MYIDGFSCVFGNSSSTIVPEKATSTPVQDIYLLNQYLKVRYLFLDSQTLD